MTREFFCFSGVIVSAGMTEVSRRSSLTQLAVVQITGSVQQGLGAESFSIRASPGGSLSFIQTWWLGPRERHSKS